jgi:hypothetical protein
MISFMKFSSIVILTVLHLSVFAQTPMRPLDELINRTDPGWPIVKQWIDAAKNKVEILLVDTLKANDALYKTQVTTRSPMGAIIYSTGGLLIDNGWIRILGSGSGKLKRSLPDWNKGKSFKDFGDKPPFLLIADDAAGGFFAINGGLLGNDPGKVYYLAPDNLEWEAMDMTYTEFLNFCFNGVIASFYEDLRWTNWKSEVAALNGDTVYSFYPYLWSKEGKDINKATRKPVSVEEQYNFNIESRKKLGLEKQNH